jgi:hypothetical protein
MGHGPAIAEHEIRLRHFGSAYTLAEIQNRVNLMAWRDLYFYWRDRHVDSRPPGRAEIDPPLDHPQLLPNLILYDRVDGDFRVRLAGSEIVRRGGRDATGRKLIQDMATYEGMITLIEFLGRIFMTATPVIYSVARSDAGAFGAIGILMPLCAVDGTVEMVLGGVFYRQTRTGAPAEPWTPGALTELSLPHMLEQDTGEFR